MRYFEIMREIAPANCEIEKELYVYKSLSSVKNEHELYKWILLNGTKDTLYYINKKKIGCIAAYREFKIGEEKRAKELFNEIFGKSYSLKKIKEALQNAKNMLQFYSGYSMGEVITVSIKNTPILEIDNTVEYRGGRYKATHGYGTVILKNTKELINLKNIDGVPTILKNNGKPITFKSVGSKQFWKIYREEK